MALDGISGSPRLRDWVSHVQNHPDDLAARHQLVALIPTLIDKMQVKDSMMLVRLSRLFAPGSSKQNQLLNKAAERGNTHALFTLAEQALQGSQSNAPRALSCLRAIQRSGDSFMQAEAKVLLESHPALQALQKAKASPSRLGLFGERQSDGFKDREIKSDQSIEENTHLKKRP